MTPNTDVDEEFEYTTRDDVNRAILREIGKIRLRERLPRIMAGVARCLVEAGVDFSKARLPETFELSDAEMDGIYEDLR